MALDICGNWLGSVTKGFSCFNFRDSVSLGNLKGHAAICVLSRHGKTLFILTLPLIKQHPKHARLTDTVTSREVFLKMMIDCSFSKLKFTLDKAVSFDKNTDIK